MVVDGVVTETMFWHGVGLEVGDIGRVRTAQKGPVVKIGGKRGPSLGIAAL